MEHRLYARVDNKDMAQDLDFRPLYSRVFAFVYRTLFRYFTFQRMLSPVLVQTLFALGTVGLYLMGLVALVAGDTETWFERAYILGMYWLVWPVLLRLACEWIVRLFQIPVPAVTSKDWPEITQ